MLRRPKLQNSNRSAFVPLCSLLLAPCSLLLAPCSLLPAPCSPLSSLLAAQLPQYDIVRTACWQHKAPQVVARLHG